MQSFHSFNQSALFHLGSALLGRCDYLNELKQFSDEHHIWLHVIGDLLGSLALFSAPSLKVNCDSLTLDMMKLFGIQNLPYLTVFLRSNSIDEKKTSIIDHSLYDFILHSPSIAFLTIWSISQRCSNELILSHMKQAFHLTESLIKRLKDIPTMKILDDDPKEISTYERICANQMGNDPLPKSVVIFRFQSKDLPQVE